MINEPVMEWGFVDGSIVKAHQHSAGAASVEPQAIGKSRGGNTSKVYLVVDSYGLPVQFAITGGEVHDSKATPGLIDTLGCIPATLSLIKPFISSATSQSWSRYRHPAPVRRARARHRTS